jgi:hypothetical protein
MKRILIVLTAVSLTSCESVPVNVAYTGHAGGHSYTAAYGNKTGVAIVVNQK